MNIEEALLLTKSEEIYRAVVEAESRNVEHYIIQKLWRNYEKALNKEYMTRLRSQNNNRGVTYE